MANVEVTDSGQGNAKLILLEFAARRALVVIGERIVFRAVALQHQIAPKTIATGQTVRSHTVSPPKIGSDSQGRYVSISVGPRTGYAKWGIEIGRQAGKTPPPFGKIYRWVKEKPYGAQLDERAAYAMARFIQMKIAREGFPAQHILSKALAIEKPSAMQIMNSSLMAVLKGGR